jgi:hypothetical protein
MLLFNLDNSKHANIRQVWGYNYNKTNLYGCKFYQNFLKCPKNENHELHTIVYAKETQIRYTC